MLHTRQRFAAYYYPLIPSLALTFFRSHFHACTLNAAQTIETARCTALCRLATPERQDRVRIRGWPSHWELNWCVCGTRLSDCNKVLLVPPPTASPATQLSNRAPWLIANCGFIGAITFKNSIRTSITNIPSYFHIILFFTTCNDMLYRNVITWVMAAEESLIGGIPLCYPKQMSTKRLFKLVGKKKLLFFSQSCSAF